MLLKSFNAFDAQQSWEGNAIRLQQPDSKALRTKPFLPSLCDAMRGKIELSSQVRTGCVGHTRADQHDPREKIYSRIICARQCRGKVIASTARTL